MGGAFVEVGEEAKETKSSVVGTAATGLSPTTRRDFDALASWLGTFPLLQEKCYDFSHVEGVLNDEAFAADMFCIANEIFDESFTVDCCEKNINKTWRSLGGLVLTKSTQVKLQVSEADEFMSLDDKRIRMLSALLQYAVSDECRQQRLYVSRIMSLSTKDQKVLMELIENGRGSKPEPTTTQPKSIDDTSAIEGDGIYRNSRNPIESPRGEAFSSPRVGTFASPEESLFFAAATGPDELFSSPDIDAYTSKRIAELQEQNQSLREGLETSKLREADLEEQMERSLKKFRKEMIKRDSASMRQVDDVRKDCEQEIFQLKTEISLLRTMNEKLEKQHKDSRDSTISELKGRLSETQEQLRLWKERVETLNDVKKALAQEEEAHSVSVEECHRLKNELKTLKPLKQKLTEYELNAREAKRQLAESGRKSAELHQAHQESEQKYKMLTKEVAELKKEADDLRRQLAEEELCSESSTSDSSEDESSTLVARLRRENMRLLEFLAEVEQQNQCELNSSEEYVVALQARIDEMSSTNKALEAELEARTSQLMESQASLSKTYNQLCEAETKYESLQVDAAKWKQRADDAKVFTVRRQQLLNKLQSDMKTALEDDKETIESLKQEVKEWMDEAKVAQDALEKSTKAHSQAIQKYACSLDNALFREEALKQQNTELVRSLNELQDRLDEERRLRDEAMVNSLDNKEVDLDEGLTVKDKSNQLMGLLVEERSVHQTQFDRLKAKYQQHLSEVKQQAVETEARIEEEHNKHITTLINMLMEDMRDMEFNQLIQAEKEGKQLREALCKANQCRTAEKGILEEKIALIEDELSSTWAHVERLSEENKNLKASLENLQRRDQTEESNYTKTAASGSQRPEEMAKLNESLMDLVTVMKAEIYDLQKDNDLLYMRLNEKLKSFKQVQDQFETLQSEYISLLGESKVLKRDNAKISSFQNCIVYALTGSTEVFSPSYTHCGFSGTTPARLRKEYELKMKSMVDEKRKLVIRSNSVIIDMQKAMQDAWEADQQVAILKKELRSSKLARKELQVFLERKGIQLDSELSDSLERSNDYSSAGDECSDISAVEAKVDSTAPELDVTLMFGHGGSDDSENLPLPSLSMDSIPSPPPPPRNKDKRASSLSVSLDAIRVDKEQEFIRDNLRGQQILTILSPSSKQNHHHVHWNEERLWIANDGTSPASPIKDWYAATTGSPANGHGTPLATSSGCRFYGE